MVAAPLEVPARRESSSDMDIDSEPPPPVRKGGQYKAPQVPCGGGLTPRSLVVDRQPGPPPPSTATFSSRPDAAAPGPWAAPVGVGETPPEEAFFARQRSSGGSVGEEKGGRALDPTLSDPQVD
jgi:hypothetical protein